MNPARRSRNRIVLVVVLVLVLVLGFAFSFENEDDDEDENEEFARENKTFGIALRINADKPPLVSVLPEFLRIRGNASSAGEG